MLGLTQRHAKCISGSEVPCVKLKIKICTKIKSFLHSTSVIIINDQQNDIIQQWCASLFDKCIVSCYPLFHDRYMCMHLSVSPVASEYLHVIQFHQPPHLNLVIFGRKGKVS